MAENPDSQKKPAKKQGEFELATPTIAKQSSRPKAKPPAAARSGQAPPKAAPPSPKPAQAPAPKPAEEKAAPVPTAPQPKTAQPPAPKPAARKEAPAPVPAQKAPGNREEDEFIENMKVPLLGAWDFVRANFKQYYIELLKIGLMKLVVTLGAFIVMVLLALALAFGTAALGGGIVGILLMAAVILAGYFAIFWLNNAFEVVAYTMTDAMLGGRKYALVETVLSQKRKTLTYTVVDAAFRIVMLIPAVVIIAVPFLFLNAGGGVPLILGLMAAYLFFIAYVMLTGTLYEFLTQFWRYGFAVESRGIVESLKSSIALVRGWPLEVIVFDFILMIMMALASIPMMVFYFAAYVVLMFVMFIPVVGLFLYLAGLLLVYLVSILLIALMEVAWRPAHCLFWKRMKV